MKIHKICSMLILTVMCFMTVVLCGCSNMSEGERVSVTESAAFQELYDRSYTAKEYADKRINAHLSQFNSDCTIVSTAYGFVSAEMPYYVVGYQCNNGVNDFFYGYKITVDDCYECAVLDEGTDTGRALFE